LFALAMRDGPADRAQLAAATPRELRKSVEAAVKERVVPPETLSAFDSAKPALARLQTEIPLKEISDTYKLKISPALLERLKAKGFKTLADLRSAGNHEKLAARLKLEPDDAELATVTAQANL